METSSRSEAPSVSIEETVAMPQGEKPQTAKRPRGRPALMNSIVVLEKIRQLAAREEGLYRIHHTHSGLYARARRQFGSWAGAVAAAGEDYGSTITVARRRSLDTRSRNRRRARVRAPR